MKSVGVKQLKARLSEYIRLVRTGETVLITARVLVSSRLSLVESCRVLIRLRALGVAQEGRLADAERGIAAVWARCELWEITRRVCEMACDVAHGRVLRALDAIHLATFVLARRELEGLELVTVDERLLAAVAGHGDAGA